MSNIKQHVVYDAAVDNILKTATILLVGMFAQTIPYRTVFISVLFSFFFVFFSVCYFATGTNLNPFSSAVISRCMICTVRVGIFVLLFAVCWHCGAIAAAYTDTFALDFVVHGADDIVSAPLTFFVSCPGRSLYKLADQKCAYEYICIHPLYTRLCAKCTKWWI